MSSGLIQPPTDDARCDAWTLVEITGFHLVTATPERLVRFYQRLGFVAGPPTPIASAEMRRFGLTGGGTRRSLTLGPSRLWLDAFELAGRPYPTDAASNDHRFQHVALVTDDVAAAWTLAADAGATAISRGGPVELPSASGGATAIKCRDPEGHPFELLSFASGTNDRWHGRGILGVDHSAIVVADVAASRRFYESHGLSTGARTLNTGPAQAALDALDDVSVDVVPLMPSRPTPHLELLGYRHPRVARHASFAVNDVAATRVAWQAEHDGLMRDPDGHLHQAARE